MSPDQGDGGGSGANSPGVVHNVWDAVVAGIVIGGLVAIVVFLVLYYHEGVDKITKILGIAAPVLAAAFGVSIGYYSGNKVGQSRGKEAGKKQVAEKLKPVVQQLDQHMQQGILDTLETAADSPAGSPTLRVGSTEIAQATVRRSREAVAALRGVVWGAT